MNRTLPEHRKGAHRLNVFITLLLSYMFVMLFPIVIFLGLYTQVERNMVENANNSNQAMIEQAMQSVDKGLDELHLLSRYLTSHPRLDMLLRLDPPQTGTERYQFLSFREEMQRYRSSSKFISDFYLYFEQSNTV